MKSLNFLIIFLSTIAVSSCQNREKLVDKSKLLGYDYRLFQGTESWELAKAVQDNDVKSVVSIVKANKALIDIPEPRFGQTLLMFTIFRNENIMPSILLELGADFKLYDNYHGRSALITACLSREADMKLIRRLVDYGANVNDLEVGKRQEGNSTRLTPLIAAAQSKNLELVKFLVEKGANVNFVNEYGSSAIKDAFILEEYDMILFLIKNGLNLNLILGHNDALNKDFYLIDELRFLMPRLNSIEHKKKQEIIAILQSKGYDYSKIEIPKYVIKMAKEEYPNNWEKYLEKY